MSDIKIIAFWVALIVSFAAYIPYWRDIVKTRNAEKPVKPNRATWTIWSVVSFMLLASYRSAGASDTIGVPIAYAVCGIATFIVSLRYGDGGWKKSQVLKPGMSEEEISAALKELRFDRRCLAVAAGSALAWGIARCLTASPIAADLVLLTNLGVDLAGAVPTIKKAYYDPASESSAAWAMFFFGNIANLFAIGQLTFAIVAYPAYMVLVSGVIAILVLRATIAKGFGSNPKG